MRPGLNIGVRPARKRFTYQGLLWSPIINIFRDRDGRGQETYGERSLSHRDLGCKIWIRTTGWWRNYFKTLATVKHFAVHLVVQSRSDINSDAKVNLKDLYETYLGGQGHLGKDMHILWCVYNRVEMDFHAVVMVDWKVSERIGDSMDYVVRLRCNRWCTLAS